MEGTQVRAKILERIQHMLTHGVIRERRFLDDEQLIRSEQLAVLEEIFNANVRDPEIRELSSHFAPILRNDHPIHLAVWGKTGTGKTLTLCYFLNVFSEMCRAKHVPVRTVHLDLSTPRPCFRALNDLACLLDASKRYQRGISLEEFMLRIETKLARFKGYLVLFVDEADNIRRDRDTFFTFLIRRLPQRISAKLVLVFASNRLNWPDQLDPRVKSFLKLNELVFKPYDALDLQKILQIRVAKALCPEAIEPGVVEKVAALASRDHGDARKAVALLARGAYLAEKAGSKITLSLVDQAAAQIEQDKYIMMIRTAPAQLQAAMAAIIRAGQSTTPLGTADAYEAYKAVCDKANLRLLTLRAFRDLLAELEMYSFLSSRLFSKGRYGRAREIRLDLPSDLAGKLFEVVRLNLGL
jgi:archaeal cell division control protein 6